MQTIDELAPTPQPGPSRRRVRAGGVGVAAVALAGLVGFGYSLGYLGHHQSMLRAQIVGTENTPTGVVKVASLVLSAYPDSMAGEHGTSGGAHPDWVSYGPSSNIWVPANSIIEVTIKNYDSATSLNSPYYSYVQGTIGGVAYYNGTPETHINSNDAGHTFTLHMFPTSGQPTLDVNVPLMGVPSGAQNAPGSQYPAANVVTFRFRTGASGRYIWQCFVPCGGNAYVAGFGGPMQTIGYMTGTVTVGSGNNG